LQGSYNDIFDLTGIYQIYVNQHIVLIVHFELYPTHTRYRVSCL